MIHSIGLSLDFLGDGVTEISKNAPVLFVLAMLIIAFVVVLMMQNRFTVKQLRIAYDTSKKDLKEQNAEQTREIRKSYKDLQKDYKELNRELQEMAKRMLAGKK